MLKWLFPAWHAQNHNAVAISGVAAWATYQILPN